MALTPQERAVLLLTRKKVENADDGYGHLCPRLNEVASENPGLAEVANRLRTYIHNQLNGWSTLESWQSENGFSLSARNHIADRLAWIDWLLYTTATE